MKAQTQDKRGFYFGIIMIVVAVVTLVLMKDHWTLYIETSIKALLRR
jgi:low affinity Fe/Cu permease